MFQAINPVITIIIITPIVIAIASFIARLLLRLEDIEIWQVLVAESSMRGKPVIFAEHSNKQIFVVSYV
jgi:hypothetical protein